MRQCFINTLILASISTPAIAATEMLFDDDFEQVTAATAASWDDQNAARAPKTDVDPDKPQAGGWFHYAKPTTPDYDIQVTSNVDRPVAEGGSVTQGGKNVLRIHRSGNDAAIAATFAGKNGGTLTATWKMLIPRDAPETALANVFFTEFVDNDHNTGLMGARGLFFAMNDGSISVRQQSITQASDSGLKFVPGQWQQWKMTVHLDQRTWTLGIDDQTSSALKFLADGSTARALVFRGAQEGSHFFVDDVRVVAGDGE